MQQIRYADFRVVGQSALRGEVQVCSKPPLSQGCYLTNFARDNCVRHAEMCVCVCVRKRESVQVYEIVPVVSP